MPGIVFMIIGFSTGILVMTLLNLYKHIIKRVNQEA
jgi:hypothetical protein